MFNPDTKNTVNAELTNKLYAAMRDGDEATQQEAFSAWTTNLSETITAQAKADIAQVGTEISDEQILAKRAGFRPMTSRERTYFAEAATKQTFTNLGETFPETIVTDVLSQIQQDHPLLSAVDVKASTALVKMIYADPTKQTAFWGTLPSNIREIILAGFKLISLDSSKLSGLVAVPKSFFKLGPSYLAQFVITTLREIMAATLETAVVTGDGHMQPIGLTKKLSGAVDGVYPDKAKIKLDDLDPKSLGGIHAALAKAKTANGEVAMLVNPMDYWSRLFPVLAQHDSDNNWHLIALPTGDTIVQTYAVPEGTAIFGVLKNYFLGVAGQVEIELYKETMAIEDADLYIAKFFGNGVAKNKDAFFVADITGMAQSAIPDLDANDPDIKSDKSNDTGFLRDAQRDPATAEDGDTSK